MKKTLFLALSLNVCFLVHAQVSVTNLVCENLKNPQGIGIVNPRLGWQLVSEKRGVMQTAYEIKVSAATGKAGVVWSSGKINSDQSVHVEYKGEPLRSAEKYTWQVRVWDNSGKASAWSEKAYWQMGLLKPGDWKAKWISVGYEEKGDPHPAQQFRKEFSASKKIKSAVAFITAHGMYEAQINGQRVGDDYLTPGWTSYNKRLQYQTYDVSPLLKNGANAVGVTLGSGWYRTQLAWSNNKNIYGKDLALLFQLNIVYTDGSTETIISDNSWKTTESPIRSSEMYDGETYDAGMEKTGWTLAGYDDKGWTGSKEEDHAMNTLVATYNEGVKKHEVFKPVKIIKTPKGEQVIDFGQNLVGWVKLKIRGNRGDTIRIYHAEVLDKQGNFYTENLRAAKQLNTYIPAAGKEQEFEPHFTFQGFRYIMVTGYPGELKAEDFSATALYSDMKPTGSFTSSNPLINQLQHNIEWGQRGNFLDVPTDCPQRDERLGWTGDAQAFSRTATFNMQVNNFFSKWLKDLAADQTTQGSVPHVIPNVLGANSSGSTGWADAATIIPWNMYLAYGDRRVLEEQYESMKAWVGFMELNSKDYLWNKGFHFGDWLFYRPDDDNSGVGAITDKYMIAQCFYANSVNLMIKTATVLNKQDDVKKYTELLKNIKDAYLKEYVTASGRLVSSTQTAYVLALNFDMLPESLRQQAADRLVENIKAYNTHLTTGFLGTPYLCHVLSRFNQTDMAYKLLLQEKYPSWLYPVKMGATTIWERWDGQKPDSTFQTPGMNSFNHYAYGAIGDWMYRVMAGLDTDESGPGYKHITIRPHIGGGFTEVAADLQTYYGHLASHWKLNNGKLSMQVEIPANTTAKVYIPASSADRIREGGKPLSEVQGIKPGGKEKDYVMVKLGSGKYDFTID
jgi:alpha-L-rhamnosidase